MRKVALLIIIAFHLLSAYPSSAEDKNQIQTYAAGGQKAGETKVKQDAKNEEKNSYHTLDSLKERKPWTYPQQGCPSGGCKGEPPLTQEPPFDQEIKVTYSQVQKAVEETQAPEVIPSEIPVAVRLSARDINRVTCRAGDIKDIVYSREKGMTVSFSGKDAYIKYKYVKKAHKVIYPGVTEMFIVCGNATYNLIAVPEFIPAKTITLAAGAGDSVRKNKKYFSGMSAEKKMMTLIKAVYTDNPQESFTVEKQRFRDISPYEELFITPARTVSAPGEGIRVSEYLIKIREDAQRQEIELDERDFIDMAANPIALAIDKLKIKKGETARMFICEQNKGDDETNQSPTIKINRGYINDKIQSESKEARSEDGKKSPKPYKMK